MEVGWITLRLMAMKLKLMRLGKKFKICPNFEKTVRSLDFLTSGAKLMFIKLRQAFIKAPILHYFDLERHIRVETDESGYAIGGVLSQLTSDDLG